MLFNSYAFIFVFFPIVFWGFFHIGKYSHSMATAWLAASSIFFYGYWNPIYVGLLLGSIICNYTFGMWIAKADVHGAAARKKHVFVCAISANLFLLGYFKYANFFLSGVNSLAGSHLSLGDIILPLGISFFTFTQIAFLADTYQRKAREYNFVHYTLFVTYFPHLIAGPVLHHQEMMPQFSKPTVSRLDWNNLAVGLAIFVLGLAKKLFLADHFGIIATPVFDAVAMGAQPTLFIAWVGALAYTLQLYFDFSAYSDMAIGLSLMFNVRLPTNFNSPYKATSIIDFWKRWHMSLSRFLRDYLYIPLGGSRNGKFQRYLNLMVTMLLGGLWHGAGWTFLIWGGLHGCYLMANHVWRSIKLRMHWHDGGRIFVLGSGLLTFVAVVVGWVFFRSKDLSSAMNMLSGLSGMNGIIQSNSLEFKQITMILTLLTGCSIVWGLPNVHQLFLSYQPTCEDIGKVVHPSATTSPPSNWTLRFLKWKPSKFHGVVYGTLFFMLIIHMAMADNSEFLYFQF